MDYTAHSSIGYNFGITPSSEFDNRKSNIDQLSKDQLKKECSNLGLDNSGEKVNVKLLFLAIIYQLPFVIHSCPLVCYLPTNFLI